MIIHAARKSPSLRQRVAYWVVRKIYKKISLTFFSITRIRSYAIGVSRSQLYLQKSQNRRNSKILTSSCTLLLKTCSVRINSMNKNLPLLTLSHKTKEQLHPLELSLVPFKRGNRQRLRRTTWMKWELAKLMTLRISILFELKTNKGGIGKASKSTY